MSKSDKTFELAAQIYAAKIALGNQATAKKAFLAGIAWSLEYHRDYAKCENCGRPFEKRQRNQKHCTIRCARQRNLQIYRERKNGLKSVAEGSRRVVLQELSQ